MARAIKQGQHIFIAFQDGEAVLDSQLRPRMYKSREQFEKSFPAWRDGKAELVEYAPTLTPPNEWVSVEERLPEKKQDVLMLFKSGNMAVGWWHDVDEHVTFWCAYTDDGFYTDCDDMPVYWMPLPAPPDRRPPEGEADGGK
ncbi:DUF551 domain-containing protein [Flintibacter sp. HCN-6482]|uniref:DUF551 domain-containing protein n=1 Tax=Flintibacter sp. HCN-6482 TaxID=3134672 RepID=UPI0030C5438D